MKKSGSERIDMEIKKPEFWSERWQMANNASSIRIKKSNQNKWMDFWNSISKNYHNRIKYEESLIEKAVNLLFNKEVLCKDSLVLDIGCGPGTYALPLSRRVSQVIALDSAEEMLGQMMSDVKRDGIKNITPVCSTWEAYQINQKFDLVLASLSPAVRNAKTLFKMNRASRRYSCLITFSKKIDFWRKIRNDLWQEIMGRTFRSYSFDIFYPFNLLYTKGMKPSIDYVKDYFSYEEPVEPYILQYEKYFSIFTSMTQTKKDKLYRYFENKFRRGIIKIDGERELCIMWWEARR